MFWKIALVEELIKSKDGLVRAVKVRVCSSESGRPVQHLVPLELPHCQDTETENLLLDQGTEPITPEIENDDNRSKRRVAIMGELRRREQENN